MMSIAALIIVVSIFSASEDAPAPSSYEAMDPERRRWLEEALESMTVDVVKQLAECIKLLNSPAVMDPAADEDQLGLVQSALDCASDFVDNIDMVRKIFCGSLLSLTSIILSRALIDKINYNYKITGHGSNVL